MLTVPSPPPPRPENTAANKLMAAIENNKSKWRLKINEKCTGQ
jgi:hypothetical protein